MGLSISQKQGKSQFTTENLWWLLDTQTRQIYAAFQVKYFYNISILFTQYYTKIRILIADIYVN